MPGLVGLGSKYFEKGLRVLFFPCNQAQSSSSLPTTTVATPRPPRAHPTHRGLPTAASPCPPQFASEEPGTAADIKAFYVDAHKLPAASLMERVDVNGANTHEVYKFLKGTPELGEKIEWNFTRGAAAPPSPNPPTLGMGHRQPDHAQRASSAAPPAPQQSPRERDLGDRRAAVPATLSNGTFTGTIMARCTRSIR